MALPSGIQNHNCLWNKVNDSPQLLFVRKEFGLSELYVTRTGRGRQFLRCGTTGRCGVPLTTLLLHVNLSIVWRHLRAFVHCSVISVEGQTSPQPLGWKVGYSLK